MKIIAFLFVAISLLISGCIQPPSSQDIKENATTFYNDASRIQPQDIKENVTKLYNDVSHIQPQDITENATKFYNDVSPCLNFNPTLGSDEVVVEWKGDGILLEKDYENSTMLFSNPCKALPNSTVLAHVVNKNTFNIYEINKVIHYKGKPISIKYLDIALMSVGGGEFKGLGTGLKYLPRIEKELKSAKVITITKDAKELTMLNDLKQGIVVFEIANAEINDNPE